MRIHSTTSCIINSCSLYFIKPLNFLKFLLSFESNFHKIRRNIDQIQNHHHWTICAIKIMSVFVVDLCWLQFEFAKNQLIYGLFTWSIEKLCRTFFQLKKVIMDRVKHQLFCNEFDGSFKNVYFFIRKISNFFLTASYSSQVANIKRKVSQEKFADTFFIHWWVDSRK